jgi:hypothetical protein
MQEEIPLFEHFNLLILCSDALLQISASTLKLKKITPNAVMDFLENLQQLRTKAYNICCCLRVRILLSDKTARGAFGFAK